MVAQPSSYRREDCRLCQSRDLELVLALAPTPIADDYVSAERLHEPQEYFPLDLFLCRACGHTQLLDVVNPDILFRNYTYKTAVSLGLVDHFRKLAARLVTDCQLDRNSLVVEIGSNDGSMLRNFQERGIRVLGIDPAVEIARQASESNIPTLPQFFSAKLASELAREHGPASLIIANNVYAHADHLGDITDGIRELLAPAGTFVFEVSYMVDIVEKMLFDTLYHEHLCYHAIRPLAQFFQLHGMTLIDVERMSSKGGSIRGIAQRVDGPRPVSNRVHELRRLEEEMAFDKPETFLAFAAKVNALKARFLALVDQLLAGGNTIAGYGASATVTTLLHHFELGARLSFLVDDNPVKQNLYSPGQHLPVLKPSVLLERRPDYVVLLAWPYAEPILKKNGAYRDAGGRFIIPVPELTLV